jgi:inositol transport system substrate-binding protein
LNAVLANNDEMALGAYRALAEAGRTDVLVIGVDGIPDAITSIENGELAGSVLQDAVGQGEGAAKTIMTALSGSTPAPITWVDFKLITPENVAEFK